MKSILPYLLLLFTYVPAVRAETYLTRDISLSILDDQYIKTCSSQGYSYFDSTSHSCKYCATASGQTADTSSRNIYGDPVQCKCAIGYVKSTNDCSTVSYTTYNMLFVCLPYVYRLQMVLVRVSRARVV
jgi:hypothetical protein